MINKPFNIKHSHQHHHLNLKHQQILLISKYLNH